MAQITNTRGVRAPAATSGGIDETPVKTIEPSGLLGAGRKTRVRSRGVAPEAGTDLFEETKIDDPTSGVKSPTPSADSGISGARIAAAGIGVFAAISNANAEYSQVSERARLNMSLVGHQIASVRAVGKEKSFRAQSKGVSAGEESLVNAAAQGQSVTGNLASGIQRDEELFGIYNAMQIESNSIREIYGLETKEAILSADIRQAGIDREAAITNAYLQGGASILGAI